MHSYQQFVQETIDWTRVRQRLSRFSHIGVAFPEATLRRFAAEPPFYCHYMSWRLGTWSDERPFVLMDEMLDYAAGLPNWSSEAPFLTNGGFAVYWSLLWQLQVATMFRDVGGRPRWLRSGPDLVVATNEGSFFVECYVYNKSFGTAKFIEELLLRACPTYRIEHDPFLPHRIPSDAAALADFIDSLLRAVLNRSYTTFSQAAAAEQYPVPVTLPPGSTNAFVYMEGENASSYDPSVHPARAGAPDNYLQTALQEALANKSQRNDLPSKHPNLIAVNFVLSEDWQVAVQLRPDKALVATSDVPAEIDAVFLAACGIQDLPSSSGGYRWFRTEGHPARGLLCRPSA